MKIRVRIRTLALLASVILVSGACALGLWLHFRYAVSDVMEISVKEYAPAEYPEDPADRSAHYGQYDGRKLQLVKKDDVHFDFVLTPSDGDTATVIFREIDVSLMTPSEPAWTKGDEGLERIALTCRQWNRQQVSFDRHSAHLEVTDGDGYERANLYSAELAKNCLNAGLWEILLFTQEHGQKTLYYQNWFTFPLGHYKNLFEHNTGLPYGKHWYKLEHWSNPAGIALRLDPLREVLREYEAEAAWNPEEPIIVEGEQLRKRRTTVAENAKTWGDFFDGRDVHFATFAPPGRYFVTKPWKNEYSRLSLFKKATLRDIVSPATSKRLQELELLFANKDTGSECRFLVSGFDLAVLPQLPVERYPEGLYMPMGIGVPPFFQSYDDLVRHPPDKSPYFSLLLDAQGHWLNHHDIAIDGPVLHRDEKDPKLLHVYLLSYERHSLIGHFVIRTDSMQ